MNIRKADLGQLTRIADGAFGVVFSADEFHLAGDPESLAYKEFTNDHDNQAASAEAAVAFRDGLSSDEQTQLDMFSAWPRALVEEPPGKICGLLMPLLPEEFFCRLIDDESNELTSRPREMQWLIAGKATRDAAQIDLPEIDEAERLFLMAHLAYAVGWLHKRRWVFGDLSFRNVAFAVDPPQLMLLDCDGAAAIKNQNRKQPSTPFWIPPECQNPPPGAQPVLQDDVTDVYKLGLAILRCLTPGRGASTSSNPERFQNRLNTEGRALIKRALSDDRQERPTAKILYSYLRGVASPLVGVPRVIHAALATPFRLRGQDVRIDWHLTMTVDVTIQVGTTFSDEIKYVGNRRGCVFTPTESGPVSIIARNKYGSVTVNLGELTLYELPEFTLDLTNLPEPQLPATEAFSVERLSAALAADPNAAIVVPDIPDIQSPEVPELVRGLAPNVSTTIPGPQVAGAVVGVSTTIKNLIMDEGERLVAELRQLAPGGKNG